MRRHARQSRGTTLIDMLALLALMGVFLVASGRLFVLTVRMQAQADRAMGEATRLDAAVNALRRDVWGSSDLVSDDTRALRLTTRDGAVTWRVGDEGGLRREAGDHVRTFGELGQAVSFEVVGPAVSFEVVGPAVKVSLQPGGREEMAELTMVSQVALAEVER